MKSFGQKNFAGIISDNKFSDPFQGFCFVFHREYFSQSLVLLYSWGLCPVNRTLMYSDILKRWFTFYEKDYNKIK